MKLVGQFWVARAAFGAAGFAGASAGAFVAQHFFLQPFLPLMAMGQSFAIAIFFVQQAFLQFALHFPSFRQSFFMAAFLVTYSLLPDLRQNQTQKKP